MLTTLALAVALSGPPQLFNQPAQRPIARHIQQTVFYETPRAVEAPFAQAGSRDSLKNGAVTGAVIGGVATGLVIGLICNAFNDNDMNCWPPTLLWAGIGAGTGALAGAGVDALFQRRVGVRVPIKF